MAEQKPPGSAAPTDQPQAFHDALCDWFDRDGRDYPWRRTTDPYAILVSEVMLQQTQVATVLERGFFTRWLERFPDAAALAGASEREILKAWEGLGYYSRARNLQKAAKAVVERHGGRFPRDLDAILALPGVGRYTAGAVASFAFDEPAPLVDANVARVLARLFDFHGSVDAAPGRRRLWQWAEELVAAGRRPRVFNSALMELGQRVCLPRSPACGACPVAAWCLTPAPGLLPTRRAKTPSVDRIEHALFAVDARERILLEQETNRRRQGLWKLPERTADEIAPWPRVLETRYGIMHYRVTLRVHRARVGEGGAEFPTPRANEAWHARSGIDDVPMPTPYRRALEALLRREAPFRLE